MSSFGKRGTEQRALLRVGRLGLPGLVQLVMPDQQGGAERAAGIAGGRLNPDVLERPFAKQAPIRHAVERHAAGHDQVAVRRSGRGGAAPRRSITSSHTTWTEAARSISFAVMMPLGLPRRAAEQIVKPWRGHRQPLAIVEVRHVQPERSVVHDPDQPLQDQIDVARLAVGRQAHQLVFAGIHPEAGVVGERRIQHAERVRKPLLVTEHDPVAVPVPSALVLHSPTASTVRMAASANGEGKNALAACDFVMIDEIQIAGEPGQRRADDATATGA